MGKGSRFIVKLKKITYPNGERLTRAVVSFDITGITYFPKDDTINEVLPLIDEEYNKLVETFQSKGTESLSEALDVFLENVSKFAIIGGLMDVLPKDLNVKMSTIEKALMNTDWFQQLINYIRSEFKKRKKADPVKYAESVRQLIEIFGLDRTLTLLHKEGIKMKRSTATALCKVAGETPKIKELIRKGLKLTIVFELPATKEECREKIAEELISKSYVEAKKHLKKIKANLS